MHPGLGICFNLIFINLGSILGPKILKNAPGGVPDTPGRGRGCPWAWVLKIIKKIIKNSTLLKPRWCQKTTRKIQYGDFLAPSGGQNAKKTRFGRCFEKTRNVDENSKRKSKVFDGSEARLALYSSLISHFRHFRRTSKF